MGPRHTLLFQFTFPGEIEELGVLLCGGELGGAHQAIIEMLKYAMSNPFEIPSFLRERCAFEEVLTVSE